MKEVKTHMKLPDAGTDLGRRDRTLFAFMYGSGCRGQAVFDLQVKNVHFDANKTKIDITGKVHKARRICLAKHSNDIMKNYMINRDILSSLNSYVFFTQTHDQLSTSCLCEIYSKYIEIARKQDGKLFQVDSYSPHTMRHTTSTALIEAGVPPMFVKNLMGHSSIETTQRHTHLREETVDKIIQEWGEKWFSGIDVEREPQNPNRICQLP